MRKNGAAASALALAVSLSACSGSDSGDANASDYYKGKTITIIVPFAPGGSSDILARLVAKELPDHIEGKPKFVVENVDGGGGASGVQRTLSKKADGLTLVFATSGNMTRWLLDEPGHDYPLPDMPTIGSLYSGTVLTIARKDAVPTLDDLAEGAGTFKAGNTSAGSSLALEQELAAKMLDVDLPQVFGYSGIGDVATALERDEVQVASPPEVTYRSTFKPLIDDGTAVPLWQNGVVAESGDVERSTSQPDIPTFVEKYEQVTGKSFEGAEADAWKTLVASDTVGSTLFAKPGTNDNLIEILRKGLIEMGDSDGWKEQCQTSFGAEISVPQTAETESALNEVFDASDDVVATLKDMVPAATR